MAVKAEGGNEFTLKKTDSNIFWGQNHLSKKLIEETLISILSLLFQLLLKMTIK